MISIFKALKELKLSKDWVLKEEPTNKDEFEKQFLVVVGVDETNSAINSSDPKDFGVTWDEVVAKQKELQAEFDSQAYARTRQQNYPNEHDLLIALWEKVMEGRSKSADALEVKRQEVKTANPKPD